MQRPKRQAAQEAILKIRDIREWETLPESSKRFKECAARIDAELESEITKKKVKTCDLDVSDPGEEESDDEFYDASDGFVVLDKHVIDADPDFKINEDRGNVSENGTEDGTSSEGCDEASQEDCKSDRAEIGDLTDVFEDDSEEQSEEESEEELEEESEEESEEEWQDAQEQFVDSILLQCEQEQQTAPQPVREPVPEPVPEALQCQQLA